MARIISYPVLSTVSSGDWIPITDTSVTGNPLKNVTVGDLQSFIIQGSTLQSVITAGNTYQGGTGPLWTWGTSGLTAASIGLSTFLSDRVFRATNLLNSSSTEIRPAEIEMKDPGGRSTILAPNSFSLGPAVNLQMPLASGVLALTTDIPASPWVPVTGGINYPTNRVGINTALPQEALHVTGNMEVTGSILCPIFKGALRGSIESNTLAITQSTTDNSTKVATTAFVSNAVGAIPSGLTFQGDWDALNNTPNIGASTPDNGDFYIVSVAGTTNLGGITDWEVGDWAVAVVSGGVTVWQKIDNSSVLTGTGAGTKMAKWAGTGTSVTLTDSAIEEIAGALGQSNIGVNTVPDTKASIYNGYATGDVDETTGIKNKAANSNTNAAINASVFGITSDATSSQTVGSASNTQGIKLNARHDGASDVAFVVGSNAVARISNGGSANASVYGGFSRADTDGALTSQNKWHVGFFTTSEINNTNHTTRDLVGAYINTTPSEGTVQDMTVLWVNNKGNNSGSFNLTGDLTYLKITEGAITAVGGTARAIHSEVTLPSLLLGSLESTGFIKTGGAATEFLMADGTVTTGAFTGNIPDGQITFGNASSNGITSSANLEFDDTIKVLTIKGTSVGQTIIRDDNVLIKSNSTTRVGISVFAGVPRAQFTKGNISTFLQVSATPTQENTIALPDKSGTVALLDDVVGSVTGTGAAGFIPVWSSATGISASTMFELGTFIGIGTQTPGAQLETTEDIIVNGITLGAGAGLSTVVVGQNALSGNGGAGNYNTAIGDEAMLSGAGGFPQSNVAVGRQALKSIDDANHNTSVGAFSMLALTTGFYNTSLGSSSLGNNTTGNNNVAIGYRAGISLASTSPNFTPSNSIFIGTDTKALGLGQTNQIVIGHEAVGLGSNTTVLGNTTITKTRLYGDIDVATGDVEVADNTKGLILSSPDGTRYRVTVANGGTLTVTAV